MKRRSGWAAETERLVDMVPGGHWHTTTMLSGIRSREFSMAMVIEGPMDGTVLPVEVADLLPQPIFDRPALVFRQTVAPHPIDETTAADGRAGCFHARRRTFCRCICSDFGLLSRIQTSQDLDFCGA